MTEIQLNMYHALALGAAMYALGLVLTKKIPVFSRPLFAMRFPPFLGKIKNQNRKYKNGL